MFWVYILQCMDGSLYTGIAASVDDRLAVHASGKGAKYTRSHPPEKVVFRESFPTKSDAAKREVQIKGWTRKKKLELIQFGKPQ